MNELILHLENALQGIVPPDELRATAFWVLEELTGLSRTDILCGKITTNIPNMEMVLQRLRRHEPLQYIFGHTLWRSLDLKVSPAVLIPRPETAELVDWVLEKHNEQPLRVIDAGTGSGCIALALQQNRPTWQITGVDKSEEALQIAKQNALNLHLAVHFEPMDVLKMPMKRADILISNPPYIAIEEQAKMAPNVLEYEPQTALFVPNEDPLLFYRRLAEQKTATYIYFEINPRFADEMGEMMLRLGYQHIEIKQDMQGKVRMLYADLIKEKDDE